MRRGRGARRRRDVFGVAGYKHRRDRRVRRVRQDVDNGAVIPNRVMHARLPRARSRAESRDF